MSEFDSKALSLARQVMALTRQKHIGGEVQLLAKIQCLFVEAMEYAAPRSSYPAWVGIDWAEGCRPLNSPVIPDGWIKCSERMPENDDFDIWVFSPTKGVNDGVAWDGAEFVDDEYTFRIVDATHWMKKEYPAAPGKEG